MATLEKEYTLLGLPVILLGIVILFAFAASLPLSYTVPWIIFCLTISIGIILCLAFAPGKFNFLFTLFLLTFVLRIILDLIFLHLSLAGFGVTNEGFFIGNDGIGYSRNGWDIYTNIWARGLKFNPATYQSWSGNLGNYDFWNAAVYSFVGYSPLTLFFINSGAGALTVILVYKLSKMLFNSQVARTSSLLVAFWPSFIFWSTQNLRDTIAILFFLVLSICIVGIFCQFKFSYIFGFLISSPVLIIFWPYMSGLFAASFVVWFLLFKLGSKIVFKHPWLIIILVLMGLGIAYWGLLNIIVGEKNFMEALSHSRSLRAYGGSAFLEDMDIGSVSSMTKFFPLALAYVIFAPFPWQLSSFMQILAKPEMIIFYFLIPFILKGIKLSFRNRKKNRFLFVIFIISGILFLAIGDANVGTMFRHRMPLTLFMLMFASFGLSEKRRKEVGETGEIVRGF